MSSPSTSSSPLPTFWRIIKNKDVEEFKSDPYLATLLNCMLWVFYGILCVIFSSAMYASPLTIMVDAEDRDGKISPSFGKDRIIT
ncbi:hypothetical protein ZWY2020_015052 [Hordeum vulgare]|nr:hypothetical protein ZWY2020_015052 [Hordeum vulgare]